MAALPETQGARERHRLTQTALAILSGALVAGAIEGLLCDAEAPLEAVVAVSVGLAVQVGFVLAPLALVLAQPLLPIIWRVWALGYSWWKILAFVAALVLVVGVVAGGWYVWWRGIILSALDLRPFESVGGGLLTAALVWLGTLRLQRTARLLLPWAVVASLGGVGLALWDVRGASAGVEALATGGAALQWPATRLQLLFDKDGDGFPHTLCVEVCDCNDSMASVSPAAIEIPRNGLDDDCFEGDLKEYAEEVAPSEPGVEVGEVLREAMGPGFDRPNVLLITVDTLRADHLSCYGYARRTSPNLDAFAAQAVRFDQARAQGPMTRFSVPSMITGRYFSELKRTGGSWPVVLQDNITLAEVLREAGYHTFAFHSIGYLVPLYGFSQGFEHYDVSVIRDRDPVHWNRTGDLVTDRILSYFDAHIAKLPAGQPWFLWAYYGDPHSGYVRHDDLPEFGGTIYDVYDQEILFTDIQIARMLDGLRERHELGTTVVILTSDHGEGLQPEVDHGFQYHGQHLYDNLLRVPFIVWAPGVHPRVVREPIGNIDVFPTVLDLTGVPRPPQVKLHGTSLVPYLYGRDFPHPPVFSEKVTVQQYPQKSMVQWPWKAIWKIGPNHFELYNIETDPNELHDLAPGNPELLEPLKRRMQVWRSTTLQEIPSVSP